MNFYLLPFVKPSMVKLITGTDEKGNNLSYDETLRRLLAREEINMAERNVLVSHQFYLPAGKDAEEVERMDSEIRTVEILMKYRQKFCNNLIMRHLDISTSR